MAGSEWDPWALPAGIPMFGRPADRAVAGGDSIRGHGVGSPGGAGSDRTVNGPPGR